MKRPIKSDPFGPCHVLPLRSAVAAPALTWFEVGPDCGGGGGGGGGGGAGGGARQGRLRLAAPQLAPPLRLQPLARLVPLGDLGGGVVVVLLARRRHVLRPGAYTERALVAPNLATDVVLVPQGRQVTALCIAYYLRPIGELSPYLIAGKP